MLHVEKALAQQDQQRLKDVQARLQQREGVIEALQLERAGVRPLDLFDSGPSREELAAARVAEAARLRDQLRRHASVPGFVDHVRAMAAEEAALEGVGEDKWRDTRARFNRLEARLSGVRRIAHEHGGYRRLLELVEDAVRGVAP